MSDKQITLLELHLHDAVQIGPFEGADGELDVLDDEIDLGFGDDLDLDLGPGDGVGEDAGSDEEASGDEGAGGDEEAGDPRGRIGLLFVGAVFALGVAVVLRNVLGDDAD